MKRRKLLKKTLAIITILFIVVILNLFNNNIYAFDTSDYASIYTPNDQGLMNIGGQILWIAQAIGYAVSVITLIIIGIQYVIKSPDQKAQIKDRLVTYAIGAAILFGATTFVTLIANFGHGLF